MELADLDRALRLAAADPAARPAFYETLLASTVYVVGTAGPPGEAPPTEVETHSLQTGDSVAITTWERASGEDIVPFFSSIPALQRALTEPAGYLALPARALFEITQGAWLVLNPGADHSKEFAPGEVAALLERGVNVAPKRRVVDEDTEVLIGQPAERPEALLDALSRFFAQRPAVQTGRLALMHDPSNQPEPILLIGVEAETRDVDRLMAEIGSVAADAAPDGVEVHLVRVAGDHFLSSVEPFFRRGA